MAELFKQVEAGYALPERVHAPVSRATLALFAGASHDHVPLHIDSDFARSAGLDDVIVHGMLGMAYLGQMLTRWAPQSRLRRWHVRFVAIMPVHASIICRGTVTEIFNEGDERLARLAIGAWIDGNVQTLDGEAVVALAENGVWDE